ncbi:MAG: hypothetical protein AB7J32_08050 [Pseudonocardia sp.]
MGNPSTWFIIAVIALVLGAALLFVDSSRSGKGNRDRRRWADLRDWEWLDSDPVLPSRWRYGIFHQGGPGAAKNLITGDVPTPSGPRQAYVFDHEQNGKLTSTVAAVAVQGQLPAAVELRLPSAPLPDDAGLDLLEPVGERYAFVTDAEAVRPLLTPRLATASDAIGEDVELLWAEDAWVLASAPLGSSPDRVQDLLADLAEVATALEAGPRLRQAVNG